MRSICNAHFHLPYAPRTVKFGQLRPVSILDHVLDSCRSTLNVTKFTQGVLMVL